MAKDSPRWHETFLGVRQQHCYGLYRVIDRIVWENVQIKRFVEIGTGGGALSVILALHALQKGSHLLTFDIQERGYLPRVRPIFDRLGVDFQLMDCFSEEAFSKINDHIDGVPCFFFCDGGNKPQELSTFAPVLPKYSVIAGHDYGTEELQPTEAAEIANALSLTPILQSEWTGGVDDIRTCFYKV